MAGSGWRAWIFANKFRCVVVGGTLYFGGSMVLLFAGTYWLGCDMFPSVVSPLHPLVALGLVGIVLLGGTFFGLRIWTMRQSLAAGSSKPAPQSGDRKQFLLRQCRNLLVWIVFGFVAVMFANYLRAM